MSVPLNASREDIYAMNQPNLRDIIIPNLAIAKAWDDTDEKSKEAIDAIYAGLLAEVDKLSERGFGVPRQGTADFEKGTFTKLISQQEAQQALKRWCYGDTSNE